MPDTQQPNTSPHIHYKSLWIICFFVVVIVIAIEAFVYFTKRSNDVPNSNQETAGSKLNTIVTCQPGATISDLVNQPIIYLGKRICVRATLSHRIDDSFGKYVLTDGKKDLRVIAWLIYEQPPCPKTNPNCTTQPTMEDNIGKQVTLSAVFQEIESTNYKAEGVVQGPAYRLVDVQNAVID